MNTLHPAPPVDPDFQAAKRQYVELYGSVAVMNTYLKLAVACLCLINVGLVTANVMTVRLFRGFKPLVVRINDVGRAEPLRYEGFAYEPREAEIKYFLIEFVRQHYGRMRATVRDDYGRSLYYLDRALADALIEANKKSAVIETFLTDQSHEIDVEVENVAIEDLRSPPYRATVDYVKVYTDRASRAERKRERYVGNFVFSFRDHVPNELIPINPLGFTITYFREDQAF